MKALDDVQYKEAQAYYLLWSLTRSNIHFSIQWLDKLLHTLSPWFGSQSNDIYVSTVERQLGLQWPELPPSQWPVPVDMTRSDIKQSLYAELLQLLFKLQSIQKYSLHEVLYMARRSTGRFWREEIKKRVKLTEWMESFGWLREGPVVKIHRGLDDGGDFDHRVGLLCCFCLSHCRGCFCRDLRRSDLGFEI